MVRASAGLWRTVARKTPQPVAPTPCVRRSRPRSRWPAPRRRPANGPPARRPPSPMTATWPARHCRACSGSAHDEAYRPNAPRHDHACKSPGRFRSHPRGVRSRLLRFVVMEREEPLQEEERQEAQGRPANGLGRAHSHRLGQHVEERGPEHAAGREAEIDLEPGVS